MSDLNWIIRVVEGPRFYTSPKRLCCCGRYTSSSVGRAGPSADFSYFNMYSYRTITERDASLLAHQTQDDIPYGHLRVLDNTTMPDGWVDDENIRNTLSAGTINGCDYEVPTDDGTMSAGTGPSKANDNVGMSTFAANINAGKLSVQFQMRL